ncbi:hypothetical protein [Vreelandella venusta]|uniref:hypothetical protein n=1 Tax=Vreelandella venusta TaxID=44935 RepID=UPI00200DB7DB|nr:hypothetical protein [Halomonas venusta]UQI42531.1 hypothetical protein M3L73_09805 [Halomonas venusta]
MAQVTFPTYLGGSGNTYSDDDNPNTGLANDGHRVRFVPLCGEVLAMGLYVYQYAAKIDNAAANADRAEDARGYVEAVADAYSVNLLDQFKRKATLGLDFIEGRYWVDAGERFETTDFSQIGAVSRTTDVYLEGANGDLQPFTAGALARGWRGGKAIGKVSGDATTNTAINSNAPDNWLLTTGATVESVEFINGIARAKVRLATQTDAGISFNTSLTEDGDWTLSARIKILEGWDDKLLVASMGGAGNFSRFHDVPPQGKWGWIERSDSVVNTSHDARIIRRVNNNAPDMVLLVEAQQVEKGLVRTPYVPVNGGTAETRSESGETIQIDGCVNASQGSFLVKVNNVKPNLVSDFGRVFSVNDGGTDNSIYAIRRKSGRYSLYLFSDGVQQNDFNTIAGSDIFNCVFSWSNNGKWFACINGTIVDQKDFVKSPLSLTQADFAGISKLKNSEHEYMYYVPVPLTQAEAIEVTQQ